MSDLGDKSKQPAGCKPEDYSQNPCPNLKDVSTFSSDCERYRCAVCGVSFNLYYDEMR